MKLLLQQAFQKITLERLICLANATCKHFGSGWSSRPQLEEILECVPMNIALERLNDGSGIEQTLKTNIAVWYKSCFNKFDSLNLQPVQKRKHAEVDVYVRPVKTSAAQHEIAGVKAYLFCDLSDASVKHRAKTEDVDSNVRQCAELVQDTALIGKLAMGDMHAQDADYHRKC